MVEVTATRWSCDHETALDSVVERVRATEILVFLLMSNSRAQSSASQLARNRASKCQIFFRISNFQNAHIFGGFRILM